MQTVPVIGHYQEMSNVNLFEKQGRGFITRSKSIEHDLPKSLVADSTQRNENFLEYSKVKNQQLDVTVAQRTDTYLAKLQRVLERIRELNREIVNETFSIHSDSLYPISLEARLKEQAKIVHDDLQESIVRFPWLRDYFNDAGALETMLTSLKENVMSANMSRRWQEIAKQIDKDVEVRRNNLNQYINKIGEVADDQQLNPANTIVEIINSMTANRNATAIYGNLVPEKAFQLLG